jgi:hypothetical protein
VVAALETGLLCGRAGKDRADLDLAGVVRADLDADADERT